MVMNSYTNVFFIMLGFDISFIRLDRHCFLLYKIKKERMPLIDYMEMKLYFVNYIKDFLS